MLPARPYRHVCERWQPPLVPHQLTAVRYQHSSAILRMQFEFSPAHVLAQPLHKLFLADAADAFLEVLLAMEKEFVTIAGSCTYKLALRMYTA